MAGEAREARRPASRAVRIYGRLLGLYPTAFRDHFGSEMVQLFADQLRDARAPGARAGTLRTWIRTIADLVVTSVAEHARQDRVVARSLAEPPSQLTRLLGALGVVGGGLLVAAFVPGLPWPGDLFLLRLTVFCVGAIAIALAVYRRQSAGGRRLALAATVPVVVANALYAGLVVRAVALRVEPGTAVVFGQAFDAVALSMWLADAWFGLVVLRIARVSRWPGLALAVGSILALAGMSRWGLVSGDFASLVTLLSFIGLALNGIAWIVLGAQVASGPGSRGLRRPLIGLLVVVAGAWAVVSAPPPDVAYVGGGPGRAALVAAPEEAARKELKGYVEDVAGATARRYGLVDDRGQEMDTITILAAPAGSGFAAVYHSWRPADETYLVHVATSTNLLDWTWRATLAERASMPTLAAASDGGYVVAWEQEPDPIHLAIAAFATWDDLLAGVVARRFDAPVTMPACGEGTPSIESASSLRVDLGFHYHGGCVRDREAGGWTDWTHWQASPRADLDRALITLGVGGHMGDRDDLRFRDYDFRFVEGQRVLDDNSSWGVFLLDRGSGALQQLGIRTDAGSLAFSNPAVEDVEIGGQRAIVVSLFVLGEGARGSEGGSLIYYRTYGPAGS